MGKIILFEEFETQELNPGLHWYSPPEHWEINSGTSSLLICPEAKTDYWQKTHYGFEADNGHFLHANIQGDFVMATKVRFHPVNQYDQAGLMVRISPNCWLKTSVEFEPGGPNRLGSVVTNQGYSDWATQDFPSECNELYLRIRREANDYIVEYALVEGEKEFVAGSLSWTQIRMARLLEDTGEMAVMAGLYACSPLGEGYKACFDFLKIESGRI